MKKRIFLADDSITIQKVVELTFSEGDYEVFCASNGTQATQRIAETSPDIALLDVVMPERNGYEVCAHIRRTPGMEWTPVLLLTGTFEPFDERRAREVGANGHLTKPFESRALVARVEDLLATHRRPGAPAERPAPSPVPPPPLAAQTARMEVREPAAQTFSRPAVSTMTPPPPTAPASRPASQSSARQSAVREEARGQVAPRTESSRVTPRPFQAPTPPATASASGQGVVQQPPQEGPPGNGASLSMSASQEAIDRAVREAVASISEKIVREVAWEVIPDLAEAIIQRRIRELEEEADSRE